MVERLTLQGNQYCLTKHGTKTEITIKLVLSDKVWCKNWNYYENITVYGEVLCKDITMKTFFWWSMVEKTEITMKILVSEKIEITMKILQCPASGLHW